MTTEGSDGADVDSVFDGIAKVSLSNDDDKRKEP